VGGGEGAVQLRVRWWWAAAGSPSKAKKINADDSLRSRRLQQGRKRPTKDISRRIPV
jgi:hypothetical protein